MFSLEKFGDRIAVITDDTTYTYNELHHACCNLSSQLSKKSLIFCFCENEIGSLVAYLAFMNSKHTIALFSADINLLCINELLTTYQPEYIYIPMHLISYFSNFEIIYEHFNYYLLKTNFPNVFPLFSDLALLLSTSGSTGSPKLVRQSFENIIENTLSIIEYLHVVPSERAMLSLPMNYTFGLSIINSHLYSGASIVLTQYTIMQKEFWNSIKKNKVTSLSGVPYTFEMLDKLRIEKMELPFLKTLTQAGGKLSLYYHKKFAKWAANTGRNFVVMYGQTEASPRMGYLDPKMALSKAGSMGKAIPRGNFYLIDEQGEKIDKINEVGELVFLGKNVALGYAESGKDLILGDVFKGCLYTGDMAKIDDDGFYYIVGRKKRFLKLYGNRVNLDECEQLIRNEYNLECACTGSDDNLLIYLVEQFDSNKIISLLAKKTSINPKAFIVKYIDIIPKNESGKILYSSLKEGYYENY